MLLDLTSARLNFSRWLTRWAISPMAAIGASGAARHWSSMISIPLFLLQVCFEVRIDANGDTSHVDDDPNPHLTRIGWSVAESSMQLGEEPLSFGFGGTGKASTRKFFKDYGKR